MSAQNIIPTGAGATAAAILPFRTPTTESEQALRARIRREVMLEVRRDVANALLEVERASRENARITECEEFAAPRYINNRLNAARQSLLNVLEGDAPDPDTDGDDEGFEVARRTVEVADDEADDLSRRQQSSLPPADARWTDPEEADLDALEISY